MCAVKVISTDHGVLLEACVNLTCIFTLLGDRQECVDGDQDKHNKLAEDVAVLEVEGDLVL